MPTKASSGFVSNNDSLTDLTGLNALTSVGSDLQIAVNDELVSLSGLDALESIGGSLIVLDNDALTTLGLPSLANVGGTEFEITGSPQLSTCDATALYDRLMAPKPSTVDVATGNLDDTPCP